MKKLKIIKDQVDNPNLRCVTLRDEESKTQFVIAKDSVGTQICQSGKFFPDPRDFGSVEAALEYLEAHEDEAIAFFKNPHNKANPADVFCLLAFAVARN